MERQRRWLTDNALEDVQVVARAQLLPEVFDLHELACVAEYRVAHGEDVEVAVDAHWPCAHERAEERDLSFNSVQPAVFSVINIHIGSHWVSRYHRGAVASGGGVWEG